MSNTAVITRLPLHLLLTHPNPALHLPNPRGTFQASPCQRCHHFGRNRMKYLIVRMFDNPYSLPPLSHTACSEGGEEQGYREQREKVSQSQRITPSEY